MSRNKMGRAKESNDWRVLTSWLATATKLLGIVAILPIVLLNLSASELNVWLVGLVALNLFNLVEFSVSPNTVRQLSYERGRLTADHSSLIASAAYTLHKLAALAVAILSVLAILGYLHLSKVGEILSPFIWAIPILLYCKLINAYFVAVLHANDRVSYHRLLEATANIFTTLLMIAALAVTNDVALLLCLQILPPSIIMLFVRHAARNYRDDEVFRINAIRLHWQDIISPTLNQMGASILGFGALQLLAIYINATNSIAYANEFLLSLRVIQSIAAFSNPIFYSHIPTLARLYKSGEHSTTQKESGKKQWKSVLAFFVITQTVSLTLILPLSNFINLQFTLPQPEVWITLAIAFLLHRIGSINLQIAALMGLVRFQFAELLSILAVLTQVILLNITWGVQNVPMNLLIAYGCVYLPISTHIRRKAERLCS